MEPAKKVIKLIVLDNQVIVAPASGDGKISKAFEIDAPLTKITSVLKKRFTSASAHIILATSQSGSELVTITSEKKSLIKDLDSHITSLTIKDQDMLIYSWETIKETDTEVHLQLFGATKKHLESLNSLLEKSGLTPVSLEPLSSVLARLNTSDTPTAFYLPFEKDDDLLIASHKGKLLGEERIKKPKDIPTKFASLKNRVKKMGFQLENIVLDDDTPKAVSAQFKTLQINTKINPIEPLHAALIQDKSGTNPITAVLENHKLPPEQLSQSDSDTITPKKTKKWLPFTIGGSVVIIIAIIGGILVSTNSLEKLKSISADPSPSPTATPSPSPTPTPTPEALTDEEKEDYTLIIQNGSGIPGTAATAQELLENLGYIVDSVGNADDYDYEETVIQTNTVTLFNSLKSDLEDDYTVASTAAELDEDETVDAIVIIGSE